MSKAINLPSRNFVSLSIKEEKYQNSERPSLPLHNYDRIIGEDEY